MSNSSLGKTWSLLKLTFKGFIADRVMKYSASLAFYTIITLGPMLIVIIFLADLIIEDGAAQRSILSQISQFAGPKAAEQVSHLLSNASVSGDTFLATLFGFVTLIIGATTVFSDLQHSLNTIWQLKPKSDKGIMNILITRLLSFATIATLGFLLLVSLLVNALLDVLLHKLQDMFPNIAVDIIYISNLLFTLLVVAVLFGFIFKVLPDASIKFSDVIPGAILTAVLFLLARSVISFYLGRSDIASTYGAAGALVLLLFWVYFSSIILFFGAEFTKAYTVKFGSDVEPRRYAIMVKTVQKESDRRTVQENEEDRWREENK